MKRVWIRETVAKGGEEVTICGWIHTRRDMGKLIFLDVRDRTGFIQAVVTPEKTDVLQIANELRSEFVVCIRGKVNARPPKQVNPNIATGTVELEVLSIEILNRAKTTPFEIDKDTIGISEEIRLKYRYLDLRSDRMQKNLAMRDNVCMFFRQYLHAQDFLEVETPILTKGTPEGAREFLVPSRIHPGTAYVLPQSPQQFKQLLMVSGVERYFQIAKAFRDEDQRGDRQPEFTQLDIEMDFVEQEDVLELGEQMMNALVDHLNEKGGGYHITKKPWPRITYKESMEKYGSDKPDLRVNKEDPKELAFAWVLDFPMYERLDDGSLQAAHHPFTRPHPEDEQYLESDPLKVRAWAYDIVLNGYEISSGSIRIHNPDLQKRIFKNLGLSDEKIQAKFGHMLEAFEFGAPPHGGFAPGLDRLVMILQNEPNIREVIPFPKTGDARDLMMGAPSEPDQKALHDAHVKYDL